jgi:hypothetical protein
MSLSAVCISPLLAWSHLPCCKALFTQRELHSLVKSLLVCIPTLAHSFWARPLMENDLLQGDVNESSTCH